MYEAYPNELERPLIFSLIQTLWDRAEANGYAHHMTDDPLPNTPPHEVLLHVGARRPPGRARHGRGRGAHDRRVRAHAVRGRRAATATRDPLYGDPGDPELPVRRLGDRAVGHRADADENGGDASAPPVPPTANTPPGAQAGQDPHEFPRRSPRARQQKSAFLSIGGKVIDVCGSNPCYAGTWTGP